MKKLEKLVNECSGDILTKHSMGRIFGGQTSDGSDVISNENTDSNGDGKADDCLYDPDPVRGDTLPQLP